MRSASAGRQRLVAGPPGSGKSHHILEAVRGHLKRGDNRFRLLTPTATMAEHVRNRLAREGFTFPAACVMTLGRFIAELTTDVVTIPGGALEIFVEQALRRKRPKDLEAVATLPGVRRLLASVCEELSSAGCDSSRLLQLLERSPDEAFGRAIAAIYTEVEASLERRGLVLRSERLITAANRIRVLGLPDVAAVHIDGFFQFTRPELDLIEALAGQAALTVTLPSWDGARLSRARLESLGLSVHETTEVRRSPQRTEIAAAPTIDRECEEVARRILELTRAGRSFRDIGIIVRSRHPHLPVLRATLERFGIPARFYFPEPLAAQPGICFLQSAVAAMLADWDLEQTLAAIGSSASGLAGKAAGYEFEFAIREQLPGAGLESLKRLAPESASIRRLLGLFEQIDSWRERKGRPIFWARALKSLRAFFRGPSPSGPFDFGAVERLRMQSAALDGFEKAIDDALLTLDPGPEIGFAQFWAVLETIMQSAEIRIQDRRRNVVPVMDVYEARQWDLPVIFVCGLVEKHFPRYPQRPVLFSDEIRRDWQNAGVHLRTTADWNVEEEFLFELATTRASDLLVLSYPEQSAGGDPLLRSFALDRLLNAQPAKLQRTIRPNRRAPEPARYAGEIRDTELLSELDSRHAWLSPSSIESFLQCPFQFFGRKTLRLRARPERPSERFTVLVQGGIIHAVLSRLDGSGSLERVFDLAYTEAERRERIVPGYRAETVKLEMLRALRQYRESGSLPLDWMPENEREFAFELEPGVRLRGRIDRILTDPTGRALVVDFKYSSKANVDKCIAEHERGLRVQGGLYMLAAENLGNSPLGMLYGGLRKEVAWRGWQAQLPELTGLGIEARTPDALREVMSQSLSRTLHAASRIRAGVIAPSPAVAGKCEYCDYRDVCRIETGATVAAVGGMSNEFE